MKRLTIRDKMGNAHINASHYSITDKLAEYEDAEEQGSLVKLPCKKNEKAWCVMYDTRHTYRGVFEATVEEINWNTEDGLKIFVRFESDLQPCCTYTFFHYDVDTRLFFGENAKEKAEKAYAENPNG